MLKDYLFFFICGMLSLQVLFMGVSKNNGTPKSSILMGFSIINCKPFIFGVPLFLETPICYFSGSPTIYIQSSIGNPINDLSWYLVGG